MNIIQIKKLLDQGNNLIFYKHDVMECYNQFKKDYLCIYFNEPLPVKTRLIEAITQISENKYKVLYRKTIAELVKILIDELGSRTLIIFFNRYEKLTPNAISIYQYLNSRDNIQYVSSFTGYFKKNKEAELYHFYRNFQLVNVERYQREYVKDEINITYTVYVFLALLFFIFYLKTATSQVMANILMGASWFAFLMFRTILFVGGRV